MKNIKFNKRAYLIAFVFVMLLNTFSAVFLIRNVLAQTAVDKLKNQPPIDVEVLKQKDSPLLINVVEVDNSNESYQGINYIVQNTGNKSVKAFVFLGKGTNTGGSITSSFTLTVFKSGESKSGQMFIERQNIRPGEKLFLSIDYIEFEDGTSWGEDTQLRANRLIADREGRKAAVKYLKDLIKNQGFAAFKNILEQDAAEITVPLPDSNQSEEWQKDFRRGYKNIIVILQKHRNEEIESLSGKLEAMEKLAQ